MSTGPPPPGFSTGLPRRPAGSGTMPGMAFLLSILLSLTATWPVADPQVTRRFDPPPHPWQAGHRGVDLAAPPGTPVRAAAAGTVVFVGRIAGRGVVSVAHPGGLRTTYEPVSTGPLHVGDVVSAGQQLGTLAPGHPGCPSHACLHWGLRRGDDYLDPLTLLGAGRVRLLPL
ncbi:M23 family metallopeptidase [Nucisporomicrobium flavum]|uniref:M23 family metallopeptidase n=1 Tax=Nucisporomicrobium flavum TaxID=2785915 RepID=UPI003557A737